MVCLIKLTDPQVAFTGEIDDGTAIKILQYTDGYAEVVITYEGVTLSEICHYDTNVLTAYMRGDVDTVIDLIMERHYNRII